MATDPVPLFSIVVPTYNGRQRIDGVLSSLRAQDLDEPYEVIVVASGSDGAAAHVAARHPWVRVIASERRLFPGPARNAGARAATGRYLGFLPDDAVVRPDWLRVRAAAHRRGFAVVGGSVGNGTPGHLLGTAGYLIEYPGVLPDARVLADQAIPHGLSYERELFERHGPYPEDLMSGEDTMFNRRLVEAGVSIAFEPRAMLIHGNPTGLREFVRHQYDHGRGYAQSSVGHGLGTLHDLDLPIAAGAYRILVKYPVGRWLSTLRRLARARRDLARKYLALSPLVWLGIGAAAAGAWTEWLKLRHRYRTRKGPGPGRLPEL